MAELMIVVHLLISLALAAISIDGNGGVSWSCCAF
jgi:hypothetical protein